MLPQEETIVTESYDSLSLTLSLSVFQLVSSIQGITPKGE